MNGKVIFVIFAVVLLVGVSSAATVEYFGSSGAHTIFNRESSDYTDNAAMLADLEAEAGDWGSLTDEEKAWEMVKYVRKHALRGYSDKTKSTNQITTAGLSNILHECHHYTYGYMCEGFAHIFTCLATLEGFEAYTISCGDLGGTGWTHSTALIRLNVNGHYRMVHVDPYFGDMYLDSSGDPLSFFTMQDLITATDYDQIYKKSIGYKYDLWSLTNSTYAGNFYDEGYIFETLYTSGTGYKVWRTNNYFITPYCDETEDVWSTVYTNPYDLFNDEYDARDSTYTSTSFATIEGRET